MGHLPKILCLHGAGSSAAIFKVQSRKVQQLLRNRFDFVFAQAPFPSQIGSDMQPFSDSGPFYRWHASETKSDYLGLDPEDTEHERTVVREYLRGLLAGDDCGRFVGVMGFSNGASIATALILERLELEQIWGRCPSFQFALLFCSTYPPASLLPSALRVPHALQDVAGPGLASVHLHGLKDPYLLQSRKLLEAVYRRGGWAECIEFIGGHHMPMSVRDVQKLGAAVERVVNSLCLGGGQGDIPNWGTRVGL